MLLSPRKKRFMGSGVYALSAVRKTMFLVMMSRRTVRLRCLKNLLYSLGSTASRSPALNPPWFLSSLRLKRLLIGRPLVMRLGYWVLVAGVWFRFLRPTIVPYWKTQKKYPSLVNLPL